MFRQYKSQDMPRLNFVEEYRANVRSQNLELVNQERQETRPFNRIRDFPRGFKNVPERSEENNPLYNPEPPLYTADYGQPKITPNPWALDSEYMGLTITNTTEFERYHNIGGKWLTYLNVPNSTLICLRTLINGLKEAIEINGMNVPIVLVRNFCEINLLQ